MLGPLVLVAAVMTLLTRGPTAIPTAEQQARTAPPPSAAAIAPVEASDPDSEAGP